MGFMRKTKGAISIFLAVILTAMIIVSGILVDGSRIWASKDEVKSALDTSAMSILTEYNSQLKELYGLFGLSENDPDSLKDGIEESLNKILMVGFKQNNKEGKDHSIPIDLFGYGVDDVNVTPLYNLSENEVVRNQVVEYMKYRAPKALSEEVLDKMMAFKDFGKQSGIMKDKMGLDKQLKKIKNEQEKMSDSVGTLNDFSNDDYFQQKAEEYIAAITNRILDEKQQERIRQEIILLELSIKSAQSVYDSASSAVSKVGTESPKAIAGKVLSNLQIQKTAKENLIVQLGQDAGRQRSAATTAKQVMVQKVIYYKSLIVDAKNCIKNLKEQSNTANQTINQLVNIFPYTKINTV